MEKITKLLLKLSRRLARAENELRNAPMDATDDDKVMVYEYTKKIYFICNIIIKYIMIICYNLLVTIYGIIMYSIKCNVI